MTEINNRIEEVKKLYEIVADEFSQFIDEFKVDVRKPYKWKELSADKKAYWQNRFNQLFPQPLEGELLTPEEIISVLEGANRNYKPSREHYLVLNSDIELKALLKAQLAKLPQPLDKELREKSLLTDEDFIRLFTEEQKKQGVPDKYNFPEAIAGNVHYHRVLAKAQQNKDFALLQPKIGEARRQGEFKGLALGFTEGAEKGIAMGRREEREKVSCKDFLKLPVEERRRILAVQAKTLVDNIADSQAKEDIKMMD